MVIRLSLLLLLGLWIAAAISHWLYKRRLRQTAPQIADGLYPPVARHTFNATYEASKFLLQRRYRSLRDPGLTRLGDALLFFTSLGLIALLALALFLTSGGA